MFNHKKNLLSSFLALFVFTIITVVYLVYTSLHAPIETPYTEMVLREREFSTADCAVDHPYASLGWGTEYKYYGTLTADDSMPVTMTLSCDRTQLKIEGAVNQIIFSDEIFSKEEYFESVELADLLAGSEVVYLDTDFTFDGYNDIMTIASNGMGLSGLDSYFFFTYDPVLKRFVYNPILGNAVEHTALVTADPVSKQVVSTYCDSEEGCIKTYFIWDNGSLVEIDRQFLN